MDFIFSAGGWLMLPIVASSVAAVAIILERFWVLRCGRIAPKTLRQQVIRQALSGPLSSTQLYEMEQNSPLGFLFAAGLRNLEFSRQIMKESIEEASAAVVHDLERFLSLLGSIAAITPLLGLLGTVLGMIDVFAVIMEQGAGQAPALAGGISQALVTTAAGLSIAIPSLLFHRFFERKVQEIVVHLEQESIKLVDELFGQRAKRVQNVGATVKAQASSQQAQTPPQQTQVSSQQAQDQRLRERQLRAQQAGAQKTKTRPVEAAQVVQRAGVAQKKASSE
ncbi:MotA/TolQ/ExbB proton channel family protein [Oceanospirillum maris]|uniref:MotA/TolQ/ExbB proton channel family protein n=1 Tax=Oceanospirillum maris TaxID=64977 RepID=UPI0004058B58